MLASLELSSHSVVSTNDKMFERLSRVLGQPELADKDKFGLKKNRLANRNQVNGIVADWTSSHDREEVIRLCSEGDVPCGPICSILDIFNEEQFWVRGTLQRVKDERLGDLAVQGSLPKLSATPGEIRHLGTARGRHNAEIFGGLLGISEAERGKLVGAGVV